MKKKLPILAAAASAALCAVPAVKAAPYVNVQVLGSTDGTNYSNSQTVTPGETVYYEVQEFLSVSGTSNTHQSNPLGTQQGPNIDGVNTISLNLFNSDASVTGITSALNDGWSGATGANAGTANGNMVSGVAAGQAAGTFVGYNAANASVVFKGSFIAGTAQTDTVNSVWDTGVATGGIKVMLSNGVNKAAPVTNTTEGSADPYLGYSALTLSETSTSPTPAPGVVPGIGALVAGLGILGLARRRQQIV